MQTMLEHELESYLFPNYRNCFNSKRMRMEMLCPNFCEHVKGASRMCNHQIIIVKTVKCSKTTKQYFEETYSIVGCSYKEDVISHL